VLAVSKPRPWKYSTLYAWRVCLNAAIPQGSGPPATKRYVVFIQRNDMVDRRDANPDDLCETEQYDRFIPTEPPKFGSGFY
jgi:hypothetical protein